MSKAKGSRNERKTIRLLEALGYVCTKAGGSLGMFDVIALGRDGIKAIQVKSNRWPGSIEMETLELIMLHPIISKEIWRWDDYAREPKVKIL